jgi:hypothetical protein
MPIHQSSPEVSGLKKEKEKKNTQVNLDIFFLFFFLFVNAMGLLSKQTISFLENFIRKLT